MQIPNWKVLDFAMCVCLGVGFERRVPKKNRSVDDVCFFLHIRPLHSRMTPEEEVEAMLACVTAWPDDVPQDAELSVLVRASKEMTRSAVQQEALHMLLLRHPLCAHPDPRDWVDDATPLWRAAFAKHREATEVLLMAFADLDATPRRGAHAGISARDIIMQRRWPELLAQRAEHEAQRAARLKERAAARLEQAPEECATRRRAREKAARATVHLRAVDAERRT